MTTKAVVNNGDLFFAYEEVSMVSRPGTSWHNVWCLCIALRCRMFCLVSDNDMLDNHIMYVYHATQTQHVIFMFFLVVKDLWFVKV